MTATDRLRELLDERGVFWIDVPLVNMKRTCWKSSEKQDGYCYFDEDAFGVTELTVTGITPEQAIAATLGAVITGDTSDGYHTFNELYHHRAVLFSVIVRDHSELAWKSKLHHDGSMYDGMFIVGIETPHGQATYHYDIDPYWDMFECKELNRAPEWDGHTPDESIARIAALGSSNCTNDERTNGTCRDIALEGKWFECSECRTVKQLIHPNYCPNCGRRVEVDE